MSIATSAKVTCSKGPCGISTTSKVFGGQPASAECLQLQLLHFCHNGKYAALYCINEHALTFTGLHTRGKLPRKPIDQGTQLPHATQPQPNIYPRNPSKPSTASATNTPPASSQNTPLSPRRDSVESPQRPSPPSQQSSRA